MNTATESSESASAPAASSYQSATDAIVETICSGMLTCFTKNESEELLSCGSFEEDELTRMELRGAARVRMSDGRVLFVFNPYKLAEGVIQACTPLEPESRILLLVKNIVAISFTE